MDTLLYAYDALNRPVSRNADAFAYNACGEVVSATITGGSPSPATAHYAYDSIGNLLSHASTSGTNLYSANSLNQYTAISGDPDVATTPSSSLSYDLDGNLLTSGVFSYAYDAQNRLASVSSNGVVLATFAYDAQGRRVRKATPSATHIYLYDGRNLVRETLTTDDCPLATIDYVWGPHAPRQSGTTALLVKLFAATCGSAGTPRPTTLGGAQGGPPAVAAAGQPY